MQVARGFGRNGLVILCRDRQQSGREKLTEIEVRACRMVPSGRPEKGNGGSQARFDHDRSIGNVPTHGDTCHSETSRVSQTSFAKHIQHSRHLFRGLVHQLEKRRLNLASRPGKTSLEVRQATLAMSRRVHSNSEEPCFGETPQLTRVCLLAHAESVKPEDGWERTRSFQWSCQKKGNRPDMVCFELNRHKRIFT